MNQHMDFKKKMILDYGTKLNEILGNYKTEYANIMAKTIQIVEENVTPSSLPQNEIALEETNIANLNEKNNKAEQQNKGLEDGMLTQNPHVNKIECTIEDAVLEDQTNLFDNSINVIAHSVNQSFFGGERRKARRQTGKKIIKRKLQDEEELFIPKKQRTDKLESFLITLSESLKRFKNIKDKESLNDNSVKVEDENVKRFQEERKDLDKLKAENIAISLKIEQELKELQSFKQNLIGEIRKLEEEKNNNTLFNEMAILEKIKAERKEIQDEYLKESRKLEAERTILIEEKKTLEEIKATEFRKLEMEKIRIEREKDIELKRIVSEKIALEKQIVEQNQKLEAERKLLQEERERIKKTLEEEREKINQTLFEERERINQTFLEISNRPKQENKLQNSSVNGNLNIQLPKIFKSELERKRTIGISTPKSINEIFQTAKKELQQKQIQTNSTVKENSESQFFTPITRNFPIFDINKINPHSLYKKSIDIQSNTSDPKKYIPKTCIPFYTNEDEFELEEKKFPSALFTKDPKLNYIVKCQSHDEIRNFFGDKKELDVEKIFSEIENVSNYSPNKLRKKNSN